MGPLVVLLLAFLQPLWALTWDMAVSSEGRLDLLRGGVSVGSLVAEELSQARGLVYLPKRDLFLFTNSHPKVSSSIFQLRINSSNLSSSEISPLIAANYERRGIRSLAFDPVDEVIYWTDSIAQAIFKAALPPKITGLLDAQVVHKFVEEIPQSLAIDYCRRKMYWTNVNIIRPSIESSLLDGAGRSVVVGKSVAAPNGLVLDLRGKGRLYWVDDRDGIAFSVETAQLDGSDVLTLHRGSHQEPMALTLLRYDTLFWTDKIYEHVWKLNISTRNEKPVKFFGVEERIPFGIVAHTPSNNFMSECSKTKAIDAVDASINTTPVPSSSSALPSSLTGAQVFCLNGEQNNNFVTGSCKCRPGFSGPHCEINVCLNYCLHGGHCLPAGGRATCRCPPGKTGDRCEVDLCHGLCLNGGECHISLSTNATLCLCPKEFEGKRCELRKDYCATGCNIPSCPDCECDKNMSSSSGGGDISREECASLSGDQPLLNPVAITLLVMCSLTTLLATFLCYKVYVLNKRPRLKRRVIVSRREVVVPTFEQPPQGGGGQTPPAGDTCEIMIENCCNMNICETPCFEPPNRLGRKMKKDDKKTLLANMDDSDVEDVDSSNNKDAS